MKRPLTVIATGFVLGEVLGLRDLFTARMLLAAALTAALLLILFHMQAGPTGMAGWILLLTFLFFGFWRGSAEKMVCDREKALNLDSQRAVVSGKVEQVSEKNDRVEVMMSPEDVKLRYLLVYLDGGNLAEAQSLTLGAHIRVSGRYSSFTPASNPGQFDYADHYRAQKLTYRFFADDLEVTDPYPGFFDRYRNVLRNLSRRLAGVLDSTADPEDAGILKSLLLGDKNSVDPDIYDLYQKNGIAHLLAISGLHLSLISAAVYGILKHTGIGFGWSGFLGGLALFSYCIMSGAKISTLRALIMVLLSYLAAWKGRTYDLLSALSLAAFLLFFESPWQLTRAGPLLSFLAIIGIAAISDGKKKNKAIYTSFGVQLTTAPVILWNYFRFPLYGVIINLFVLPLMGAVAASGTAGMLAGLISPLLGRFFLGMAHYILLWYDLLCRSFGSLPASSLLLGRPTAVQTGIYYGTLVILYLRFVRDAGAKDPSFDKDSADKTPYKKAGRGRSIFYFLPLFLILFPLPVMDLNVLFMDVGQGDGILIRSEAGVVLVDGGSSSVSDLYEERLKSCLESQAVSKIDYAIVSHSHSDHVSGLYMLLSDESPVRVKNLILPAAGKGDESYDKLIERAKDCKTTAFWMETGDTLDLGKMRFTCLYPSDSEGVPDADPNEHSLLLRLDYGGFSMMLGGDMTENGERAVLAEHQNPDDLSDIKVLKVSHHGSATSSSGPWLDALRPYWAVISYGKNNVYGHPAKETKDALIERDIMTYETARDGAISLWTNGERIRWRTFYGDDP